MHIDTSGEQIGSNEHADGTLTELLHDDVSLDLVHLTVHDRNGKVLIGHNLFEFFDTLFSVAINKRLVNVEVRIKVKEHLHLPFFLLNGDVVLMNTFEGQLLVLNENFGGIAHKVACELKNFRRQSGRKERNLDVSWQEFENALNLFLKTAREHLVGLIKNEKLEVVGL